MSNFHEIVRVDLIVVWANSYLVVFLSVVFKNDCDQCRIRYIFKQKRELRRDHFCAFRLYNIYSISELGEFKNRRSTA